MLLVFSVCLICYVHIITIINQLILIASNLYILNILQNKHLIQLIILIFRWWKDLYGYVELSHVRDRAVESYLWSYALFYEENLTLTRMILAKIIGFTILMDDTYDDHATIEECRKLNEAIQRFD